MRTVIVSLSLVVAAGCASAAAPSTPVDPGSAYAATFSSSRNAFAVPAHEAPGGDLVVRPDGVVLNFAVRATGADRDAALARLHALVDEIGARIKDAAVRATPTAKASVRPCGFRIDEAGRGVAVQADGAVEIALPPELDYWGRAGLLAALDAATRAESEAVRAKGDDGVVGFGPADLVVRDPDAYREELVRRWSARVHAFAAGAGAALAVAECTPPAEIAQRRLSLEEVALSLPVQCKLGK